MLLAIRKGWSFIKNYWYVPLIAVLIVVGYIVLQKKPDSLVNLLLKTIENHKKEVRVLDEISEEERKKREKNLQIYQKTLKDIEENYKQENQALSLLEKRKIKKIIEENSEDDNKLVKELQELLSKL